MESLVERYEPGSESDLIVGKRDLMESTLEDARRGPEFELWRRKIKNLG
jgi:hypothetical protein